MRKPALLFLVVSFVSVFASASTFVSLERCTYEVTTETLLKLGKSRTPIVVQDVLEMTFAECVRTRKLGEDLGLDDRIKAFTSGAIRSFHKVVPGYYSLETQIISIQAYQRIEPGRNL